MIETSMFGAEFLAMKTVIETLRGLGYKQRIMGVTISDPPYISGDNMPVMHNNQRPESVLQKNSNYIFYHAFRESVAMDKYLTGNIGANKNCAVLATEVLYGGKRKLHT